VVKESKV